MANALNRTFVLPPIVCNEEGRKYCTLCRIGKDATCHNRSVQFFNNPVKESVFFMNDGVSNRVKEEDAKNPIYRMDANCVPVNGYRSDFPACSLHSHSIVCIPCNSSAVDCAIQFGQNKQERVLKYYSLPS